MPRRLLGAVVAVAAGLVVAGCGTHAPVSSAGKGPPIAAAVATAPSLGSQVARRAGRSRASGRAVRRTSPHPAVPVAGAGAPRTPASPRRPRTPVPSQALARAAGAELAAPACAVYAEALAGRFPDPVAARGERRALALATESTAAALLGLPVLAPRASLPARERLDQALSRLSRSLAATGPADPNAIAARMGPRIRGYAVALGVAGCG